MCLYPKLIKNRKYIANKKNGGNIPPVSDLRVLMVPVGCGKCIECKKQKSREWSVRLQAYRDWETDRKSTRLNSSHSAKSRMPSSA